MNEQTLIPDSAAPQTPDSQMLHPQMLDPQVLDPGTLNLRDIHLPEPISWWPIAPGWWIVTAGILLLLVLIFITRKIYLSHQLKRDISSEIDIIKQQFQQTQNRSELARSLSILLRRASITYYPAENIAGLTGEDWLSLLDTSWSEKDHNKSSIKFHSDVGKILITAPYQAEDSLADFDAQALIQLCESWLLSSHDKIPAVETLTAKDPSLEQGRSVS